MMTKPASSTTTTPTPRSGRGRFLRLFRDGKKRLPVRSASNETAETSEDHSSSSSCTEPEPTLTYDDVVSQGPLRVPTQRDSLLIRYGSSSSSTSPGTTTTTKKKKCTVRFSETTVHYHSLILGDSPSLTTGGVPLALGQERTELRQSVPVDTYVQDSSKRRTSSCACGWGGKEPLVIPASARTQMLVAEGVDQAEITKYEQYLKVQKQNPHLAARLYPHYVNGGGGSAVVGSSNSNIDNHNKRASV